MELLDLHPATGDLREEVLAGLRQPQHTLPTRALYDRKGSLLFDQITELDEYYPTRTELKILQDNLGEIAKALGPDARLVDFGSGSSMKTHTLLDGYHPATYVPVEISRKHLLEASERLVERHPGLVVQPVCADYTQELELPEPKVPHARTVAWFSGSTIGNFTPDQAVGFLSRCVKLVGEHGGMLVGADLVKPAHLLEAAYNDRDGVTAAFNLNLLAHLNDELGTDFDLSKWRHLAVWDPEKARIEMRLIATEVQSVQVGDETFAFEEGEYILTEYSHKFTLESFADLAGKAGFSVQQVWTDPDQLFSVQYLVD